MNASNKQKLVVPVIIFVALFALNVNSIVNGFNQHNNNKIIIASASFVLVIIFFIVILRSAYRKDQNGEV